MSKAILVMEMPECCEFCRFIDYEPKCNCRMLLYKDAKIEDRLSRLANCPLREIPEYNPMNPDYTKGWNDCLDVITGKVRKAGGGEQWID
jgi:hypothetical protein